MHDQDDYPQSMGTDTLYLLSGATRDTIRLALHTQVDQYVRWLDDPTDGDYWVDELWQIHRACRALGIRY